MGKKKYKDIKIGDIFGKLTVVSYDGKHSDGRQYWNCSCSCDGNIKSYKKENLNNGNTTSCGCLRHVNNVNNNKDYTGMKNDYGVELIRRLSQNVKKQWIWECKCGYCGKIFFDIPARILNNHVKSCGCLKTNNADKRTTKIKYSFAQWCKDNNHEDYLKIWDYNLNKKDPNEISYGTTHKFYFKCPLIDNKHPSQQFNVSHITNRGDKIKCCYCNSFANWGIKNISDNFIEEYWDKKNNIGINPWTISYSSGQKVKIKCQNKSYHGSYLISPGHFVFGGRCSFCNSNSGKVHPLDSLGSTYDVVKDMWSNKNKKTCYEYSPNCMTKVWFKCSKGEHEDYLQSISNAVRANFRCPLCSYHDSISRLQHKITEHINKMYSTYTLLHEQYCSIAPTNPLTNRSMRYDNEIKELKLIIEVHGPQHYKLNWFHKKQAKKKKVSPEQLFNEQLERDKIKEAFAKDHGYYYLIIPYWEEKKDMYKNTIDNMIKNIINN